MDVDDALRRGLIWARDEDRNCVLYVVYGSEDVVNDYGPLTHSHCVEQLPQEHREAFALLDAIAAGATKKVKLEGIGYRVDGVMFPHVEYELVKDRRDELKNTF